MSDMTLNEFTRKFIKNCEAYDVEFDEELFYRLVENRYGKDMIPIAKTLVLAWQNDY